MRKEKQIPISIAGGVGIIILVFGFVMGSRWDQLANRFGLNQVTQGLPNNLDYSEVEEVYDVLKAQYDGDLTVEQILDGLKEGLAGATDDPYTVYLSEEETKEFNSDLNGTFSGIGAELGLDNDRLIIVAPLSGFPADKAGLRAKDIITQINGEDAFGLKVEEAVTKIRGPKGTDVTLTIFRDGKQEDYTITREDIVVPSVEAEVKDGVGVLKISRFANDTVSIANREAQSFVDQGIKKIVLDLRNNSGGYLDGAVKISSLWLDGQTIVQTKRGGVVTETQKAQSGAAILAGLETIVLINGGSASASEIVAGALKDNGAATLLGETTFGKGSVQELDTLPSGGTLKVTIARWFTPNGNNIDKDGIKPDIEISLTEEDIEAERDAQLNRAIEELK